MPTFGEVEALMDPPTKRLFLRLVENHLAHIEQGCTYFVANVATGLRIMASHGGINPDGATMLRFDDLASWGLLRRRHSRSGPAFTVPPEAVRFYRYLSGASRSAVAAVEAATVRESGAGSTFAMQHPEAAHHLDEAVLLLSSNDSALTVVNELGGHLRSALHMVASSVLTDYSESPEKAVETLVRRTSDSDFHADPATAKLAAFAQEVLREAMRLDHIRDDEHLHRPFQGWEEMRRAVFLTTVCCIELGGLAGRV